VGQARGEVILSRVNINQNLTQSDKNIKLDSLFMTLPTLNCPGEPNNPPTIQINLTGWIPTDLYKIQIWLMELRAKCYKDNGRPFLIITSLYLFHNLDCINVVFNDAVFRSM